MPKRLKKAIRKLPISPKPKRSSDPNLARSILEEHMGRVQGTARAAATTQLIRDTAVDPDDKPPTFDELYRARMAELGAKGGRSSGAKRMENLSAKDRKAIAKKAAAARWKK
jgi:hypothetical protein